MFTKLASAKNKVVAHKTEILIYTLVAVTGVAVLQHSGIKQLNQFLDEKGLTNEYYLPEA